MTFRFETPHELIGRLKIGREEFLQRLMTSLILHAPYPRWNSRNPLAPRGADFLRSLHALSFPDGWGGDDGQFVDEFLLPARRDADPSGYPDWAVLWENRLWVIELKTDWGSQRPDQLPMYFDLAHHNHPNLLIDITYLAPAMQLDLEAPTDVDRFAHVTWTEIRPLVEQVWHTEQSPGESEVVRGVLDGIDGLDQPPRQWLDDYAAAAGEPDHEPALVVGSPSAFGDVADQGVELAGRTAQDGEQRALDVRFSGLDALQEMRETIKEALAATEPGSPLRQVRPWQWTWESTGQPLTEAGRELGWELRLSRYRQPNTDRPAGVMGSG